MNSHLLHIASILLLLIDMMETASITEESLLLNVFTSTESWKAAQITTEQKIYVESFFSQAFYHRECEHEAKLKPVYYYPGETIRIECAMCNIALILNGAPKGWARIRDIDSFMQNEKSFGSKDGPKTEIIENAETNSHRGGSLHRTLNDVFYYQENGFLIIENANASSQGVYFCFDRDSAASQRHFHILIPIVPVFHIAKQYVDQVNTLSRDCSNSERSFPNHHWIESNKVELFDDQETCFTRNGKDDWSCYDYRTSVRTTNCKNPASSCKLELHFPTIPSEISLWISLHWSPWSQCNSSWQTRIGQCYLTLGRPISESETLTKKWSWLKNLNRLTNHISFREGVPLFNGLLASWLYGVESLKSCLDVEFADPQRLNDYHDFFSKVFTSISPNSRELHTPESAFKYCIKHEKLNEKYDVLLGTYTEDRRRC